ncbi:hypothetical protein [Rhodococcus sp. ARC_M6]|uniref:hypothetical protein n=1 Tax=Rhodococcus sp. ARC_M6 TaxID=2928852 RepID=UPI001FB3DE0B|nr:hypothetical protein [Rhodococcus sp. ARC_M6]MCJ0907187.1 hypothetical protein [Rhodococcus sp. ARC_M6]
MLAGLMKAERIDPSEIPAGILDAAGRLPTYQDFLEFPYELRSRLDNTIERILEAHGVNIDTYAHAVNSQAREYSSIP